MANSNQQEIPEDNTAKGKATHNLNGSGSKKQGKNKNNRNNRNQQNQNNVEQFYPDKETALKGTSHYSSCVVFKDFSLLSNELQRVEFRHNSYLLSVIHQLENATLARFREKHVDLVRTAINNVEDELDRIEMEIDKQMAEFGELLKDHEPIVDVYSNPKEYKEVPVQTRSGLKWIDLLVKADELFKLYDEAVLSAKVDFDQIERADRMNTLVKTFNEYPSFVNKQNRGVEEQAKKIERAAAR